MFVECGTSAGMFLNRNFESAAFAGWTKCAISTMRDVSCGDVGVWSGAKSVHESQPAVGKLLDKHIAQRLRGLPVRSVRPVGCKGKPANLTARFRRHAIKMERPLFL